MSDKSSQTQTSSKPGSDSKSSSPASTTTGSSAASSGDTEPEGRDKELEVLSRMNKKLLELTPETRARVVDWLYSRHRAK